MTVSDPQEGTEMVTVKITPRRSFNGILIALETDKDATLLTDTASLPVKVASPQKMQWNFPSQELNKEYTFSVQLRVKNTTGKHDRTNPAKETSRSES